jgi:hypothetical protein
VVFDLPEHFYGGSRFFINSLIDQYKNKQNFLILRTTINESIKININNNYFFNFEYDNNTIKGVGTQEGTKKPRNSGKIDC